MAHRSVRVINLLLWDSCLSYESFSFRGNLQGLNPRTPLQVCDTINYDMDSEEELQELLGEDMNSDGEEGDYDSETGEYYNLAQLDAKGNDIDLINEGWIVDDDYISDSEGISSLTEFEGENIAEYELRR